MSWACSHRKVSRSGLRRSGRLYLKLATLNLNPTLTLNPVCATALDHNRAEKIRIKRKVTFKDQKAATPCDRFDHEKLDIVIRLILPFA